MFYSETLPKSASSAARARRVLDRLRGRVDDEALANARLLVSELVANAVEHVPAEGEIGLRVDLQGATLRVEVLDPGAGFAYRERQEDDPQGSGWGLHFMRLLADRWAIDVDGTTRVWFEVESRRNGAAAA